MKKVLFGLIATLILLSAVHSCMGQTQQTQSIHDVKYVTVKKDCVSELGVSYPCEGVEQVKQLYNQTLEYIKVIEQCSDKIGPYTTYVIWNQVDRQVSLHGWGAEHIPMLIQRTNDYLHNTYVSDYPKVQRCVKYKY